MNKKCDNLMERLRTKSSGLRSLQDLSKGLRLAMLDKRQGIDAVNKAQLHRCLEILQDKVKLHSLHGTLDRIEGVAKLVGCKYSGGDHGCFIDCGGACRVQLDFNADTAVVNFAKVQHQAESLPNISVDIAKTLTVGDYVEFRKHLQGLVDIYNVSVDTDSKNRIYPMLCAMEGDLAALMSRKVHASASVMDYRDFALVRRRCGGRPMHIVHLIPPRELLDLTTCQKISVPSTADLNDRLLGHWLELRLVNDPQGINRKLPLKCLFDSRSATINGGPVESASNAISDSPFFTGLSAANSCFLPLAFQLRFSRPLPFDLSTLKWLHSLTGISCYSDLPSDTILINAIIEGNGTVLASKSLFVQLPDETHNYHIGGGGQMKGVMLERIFFTHPSQFLTILSRVRRQALLFTLIRSFVRVPPKKRERPSDAINFEVTAVLKNGLTLSFENPHDEWLSSFDIELTEDSPSLIVCRLHTSEGVLIDDISAKILRECLSIPVMMRSLLRRLKKSALNKSKRSYLPISGVSTHCTDVQVKTEPVDYYQNDSSIDTESNLTQPPNYPKNSMSDAVLPGSTAASCSQSPISQIKVEQDQPDHRDVVLDSAEKSAYSELDNIEATVRQIELDKAQAMNASKASSQSVNFPSFDIFGFPSGTGPNLPSSLTITPIPNKAADDRRKDRKEKDRDRGDKRKRREDSPSSRSNRVNDARGSSGSKEKDHVSSTSAKPSLKASSASPPPKKHPLSSSSSPGHKSSSSSLSKHKFLSSKHSSSSDQGFPRHPSPNSQKQVNTNFNSTANRILDKQRDKNKLPRPKSDRVESSPINTGPTGANQASNTSSCQVVNDVPITSTESSSPVRSRKSSLSDVISKLNTLVSNEEVKKEESNRDGKSEFIVKSSTDGIKLTINKTKSRSSSSSPSGIRQSQSERSSPSLCAKSTSNNTGGVRKALYRTEDGSDLNTNTNSGAMISRSVDDLQLLNKSCQDIFSVDNKSALSFDSDLPPLPKSLEIKKIDRVNPQFSSAPSSSTSTTVESQRYPSLPDAISNRNTALATVSASSTISTGPLHSLASANVDSTVTCDSTTSQRLPVSAMTNVPTGSSSATAVTSCGFLPDHPATASTVHPSHFPPPPPPPQFPSSPSVQIHIVRSPAPVSSPRQLCLVSPRSSTGQPSPCVIDDDLMDEALLGLGK